MNVKITPNINNTMRVIYLILGLAMAISPLLWRLPGWKVVLLPVLGLATIASGATGF